MTNYRKKLIEVALPLDAINAAAKREKSIRSGHPSTFHLWWARRPLAAARAVLFASLVDDPSSRLKDFPDEESQEKERLRLFEIIEALVKWENTQNHEVIEAARQEIRRSAGGHLPTVVDPFAGGGSIPLSAQFLGLDVQASDLNPIAVLITKALVELPPKFSGQQPIGPTEDQRLHSNDWPKVSGLVEDIRRYGRWMDHRARELVGKNYPTVTLPLDEGGGRATAIAWIWARTITCQNPACGAIMPLLNSFLLSRKKNREAWLEPIPDLSAGIVKFKIRRGSGAKKGGTVTRSGATCLACGSTIQLKEVRAAAKSGDLSSQLLCTVSEGTQKIFVEADEEQIKASIVTSPSNVPTDELPYNPRAVTTTNYGIDSYNELFTPRQLQTVATFVDLVTQARTRLLADGGSLDYADAINTYLCLAIGRLINGGSNLCFWDPGRNTVQQVFARNALPMVWTYAEANPFSDSSRNFLGQVDYLVNALSRVPAEGVASVSQLDARRARPTNNSMMVCTDPPYYDNVPYADLSDFFYVWFRQCLKRVYPELFSTILVPKSQELIAEPARHGGDWSEASAFFEEGLRQSFENILHIQDNEYPFTIFYAFKQAEDTADGASRVSTGWEKMLQGLLDAGTVITGTWPIRTEKPGGLREVNRAALASSIVLVCRRRLADAPLTTRRDFITTLRDELPDALRRLQQGNIAPVDLAQASIGPGMAIFSRYSKVTEAADGRPMPVRAALAVINQVLDEVLASQEADFDGDTRWAVAWFEQHGLNEGSAGMAETLSKAKNTSIGGLVQAGILEQRGNKCRLLNRGELDEDWTPGGDERITVWEVVQHLIRTLDTEGEAAAGALLASVGGLGEPARELAYRLYATCEKRGWSEEALAYNGLVVAWPELVKSAGRLQTAGADARLFE